MLPTFAVGLFPTCQVELVEASHITWHLRPKQRREGLQEINRQGDCEGTLIGLVKGREGDSLAFGSIKFDREVKPQTGRRRAVHTRKHVRQLPTSFILPLYHLTESFSVILVSGGLVLFRMPVLLNAPRSLC